MREFVARAASRELAQSELLGFSGVLAAHVRKEERQLFETLQNSLAPQALQRLGNELDAWFGSSGMPGAACRGAPVSISSVPSRSYYMVWKTLFSQCYEMRTAMPSSTQSRLFRSSIPLPANKRSELVDLLNARLADICDLKTQVKFAHWNVKGPNFIQFHELFDSIAGHAEAQTDLIAERITSLGGVAHGTARQAANLSSIPEYELRAVIGLEHARALAERLAIGRRPCAT